ncbi:serine/threonine-protein kinase [Synechocystis sp. PCC 7509]|uniref:serine/threonine-protein kinase n=1 Tax=Synechocystis sp. PCC 7509 TaxID=927677 RepID=UPI0002ACCC95|nr:serine/threonine-protein kinase [Synechocystis sp. PCC 7509]
MPPTTPQYCTKGHENPSGSRFCLHCGEQMLSATAPQGIYSGLILGNRYRIIRQLGQGGFGRTYLAADVNRFNEYCVLKEFAPQVQTSAVLQKAEELFAREAGVLYQLQHPQIPRFRELFRVNVEAKDYLFLVQDYVEGKNLFSLLHSRQPPRLLEAEVTQLLLDILPVLEYIHSRGVIHRDISPDNLILRDSDSRPVLIDFGGVKQIVATVSQLAQSEAGKAAPPATLLGKVGYAPNEQMRTGTVYPHSDLYALAVTALVLLTGIEPQSLIDPRTLSWQWEQEVNVSNTLATILNKMLQPKMSDRYQTAREVWQALNSTPEHTLAVAPVYTGASVINTYQAPISSSAPDDAGFPIGKTILGFLMLFGLASATFWGVGSLLQSTNVSPSPIIETPPPVASISPSITPTPSPSPQLSAAESAIANALIARRQNLGIDENYYFNVINQLFWAKYPTSSQGRKLTNEPADSQNRVQWYKIADQLLTKLETISVTSRQKLGSYTKADRDRAVQAINQVFVGSRSLYDLTDATFFGLFPDQKGKNFANQPIGQIWNAIAQDKASNIIAGTAYEKIAFAPGSTSVQLSGSLNPGEGKVFVAQLALGQLMQIDLQAEAQVLISVYSPTGKTVLLEDSAIRAWSETLPEDGYYEIVVVTNASAPMDYQLNLSVEDKAPEPIIEPSVPETPPTPTPTETSPSQ